MSFLSGAMRLTYFCIWARISGSLTYMFSNSGENTSRSTPTMRLSSSKMSWGTVPRRAFSRVSVQHLREGFELVVEFGHGFAFGRCAHDYAEVFGAYRFDEVAQA